MSKLISFLEKHNLVEKIDKEPLPTETPENPSYESTSIDLEENLTASIIEDIKHKPIAKTSSPIINKEENSLLNKKNKYDKQIDITEIYSLYNLDTNTPNTVFMLENLINALPQNLPEDVMKQTIRNIIVASNINLNELLSDGEHRLKALVELMNDYYIETNNEISQCKAEIAKLSTLINGYQERIKTKELMLQEQSNLVKSENQRIENITNFFSN
ncbi:hypothetical protein [Clostridium sp.]|uniref:hypothetical protein n=1 Tax=Clostridium sp. TaxID=1506 RepID=UPI002FC9DCA5